VVYSLAYGDQRRSSAIWSTGRARRDFPSVAAGRATNGFRITPITTPETVWPVLRPHPGAGARRRPQPENVQLVSRRIEAAIECTRCAR